MINVKKIIIWFGIVLVALLLVVAALWFFNGGSTITTATFQAFFGSAEPTTPGSGTTPDGSGNAPLTPGVAGGTVAGQQKVFLISPEPVVAATLIKTGDPSIATARYITATDGHVLDVQLDVPGAFPQVVSQTTIPGVQRALWTNRGSGVLMQYLEGSVVKTVHLSFAIGSSTDVSSTLQQTLIRFLPDNIVDIAASPDGSSVSYLVRGASGVDGYVAGSNGSNAKKLFSLPLTEVTLTWTAPGALLLYSRPGAGIPGIVFTVNTKTGAVSPILHGLGISALANADLTYALYQISDGSSVTSYSADLGAGASAALAGAARGIMPETCMASSSPQLLYCAAPRSAPGGNFIDLWHQGLASAAAALVSLNMESGLATMLAVPGGPDGGESSDIVGIAVALDGRYASFVNKSNGRLYGVRLTP